MLNLPRQRALDSVRRSLKQQTYFKLSSGKIRGDNKRKHPTSSKREGRTDRQWQIQKNAQSETKSKQHSFGPFTLCRIEVPPPTRNPRNNTSGLVRGPGKEIMAPSEGGPVCGKNTVSKAVYTDIKRWPLHNLRSKSQNNMII